MYVNTLKMYLHYILTQVCIISPFYTQMLTKFLLLATLVSIGKCGENNLPTFIPEEKVIDCTNGKSVDDICDINFVVEPLTSMTYYNITDEFRELKGFRAGFNSNGNLVPLLSTDLSYLTIPPIQVDGHFRPIITINAQMPGPTIIAHEGQMLNITVFNELKNVEGISIHWHGMHQIGTQGADGVAYITQRPIPPLHNFEYKFKASPAGTHWYHAHSGAQRTDGMYGALIVKDMIPGNLYNQDLPDQHTLMLMDWQRDASIDLFYTIGTSLRYWKASEDNDPAYIIYNATRGPDFTDLGPTPFWSAIINDKGRHFNETGQTNIKPTSLNYFNVTRGNRYRFRLIGVQALYPFRFSIEGHKLTVIATDGNPIKPIENVDYVIINTGERYDVVVHANNTERKNFWIWSESLEVANFTRNEIFYNPIDIHRGEAILHYEDVDSEDIADISETWECTPSAKCRAVNCPFYQYGNIMNCVNADDFESLSDHEIPAAIYSPDVTIFTSFGFHGELSTLGSSVDGVNFRFPANPPLTQYRDFQNSGNMCPRRGCDHSLNSHCACTQVYDINNQSRGSVVELIVTNRDVRDTPGGTSHPVHLHGHYFYVVEIGYPVYNMDGQYVSSNDDIECVDNSNNGPCQSQFTTVEGLDGLVQDIRWKTIPDVLNQNGTQFARKDTVIVPYGGYTVIRFMVDNPGWWFFHCHIEIHQLEGMAAVFKELQRPSGT